MPCLIRSRSGSRRSKARRQLVDRGGLAAGDDERRRPRRAPSGRRTGTRRRRRTRRARRGARGRRPAGRARRRRGRCCGGAGGHVVQRRGPEVLPAAAARGRRGRPPGRGRRVPGGGQRLDAVDDARPRAGDDGAGVDRPHRGPVREPVQRPRAPGEPRRRRGRSRRARRAPRRRRRARHLLPRSPSWIGPRAPRAGLRRRPRSTRSGTQWPATNGGSVHSRTRTRGAARPAIAAATASRRSLEPRPQAIPAVRDSAGRSRRRRAPSRTSASVCGSRVTTCAGPTAGSASWTVREARAHTAHRSWVSTTSGAITRTAAVSRV